MKVVIVTVVLTATDIWGYLRKRRNCDHFAHYHLRYIPFMWFFFSKWEDDKTTCPTCYRIKAKGRELEFISIIYRDGSGTEPIDENMSYLDDTVFKINSLSISNKTFIASEFNSYVVRLKKN